MTYFKESLFICAAFILLHVVYYTVLTASVYVRHKFWDWKQERKYRRDATEILRTKWAITDPEEVRKRIGR